MDEEWRDERLRQISDLCAGQAFDHGKSLAEIMAEQIIVRDQQIAALTAQLAERDAQVAALREERDALAGRMLSLAQSVEGLRILLTHPFVAGEDDKPIIKSDAELYMRGMNAARQVLLHHVASILAAVPAPPPAAPLAAVSDDERIRLSVENATLTYQRGNLLGILRHIEWSGEGLRCPFCWQEKAEGHRQHCDLGSSLRHYAPTPPTAAPLAADTKEDTP